MVRHAVLILVSAATSLAPGPLWATQSEGLAAGVVLPGELEPQMTVASAVPKTRQCPSPESSTETATTNSGQPYPSPVARSRQAHQLLYRVGH
jgi:hypothetical protein